MTQDITGKLIYNNSGPSSFPKTVDGLWDELMASDLLAITLLIKHSLSNEGGSGDYFIQISPGFIFPTSETISRSSGSYKLPQKMIQP
jgi:hypothetical protein